MKVADFSKFINEEIKVLQLTIMAPLAAAMIGEEIL